MAGPLHIGQRPRISPMNLAEPFVLPTQGPNMPLRRADDDQKLCVGKETHEEGEAGDMIVGLGNVAHRILRQQELAYVGGVERFKFRASRFGVQDVVYLRIMKVAI